MAEKEVQKFPSEMVDLPSKGTMYPKDSPISSGQVEVKYMTAKEEDILTSQNLIKKGLVIEKLLDSLILTPDINTKDLILGDKNAIMVAARILAYGPEYTVEVTDPNTGNTFEHTFDLSACPFKDVPSDIDYSNNEFEMTLPASKLSVTFKLLDGIDEQEISKELKALKKLGQEAEVTTRLKRAIKSIDGNSELSVVNNFVQNMLSRDSRALREEMARITPDIDLKQEVELEGGETVTLDIPMAVEFFWPKT
jgi:hypothetical protein